MTRLTCATLLLLTIPVLGGCSGGYEVGTGLDGSGDSSTEQAAEPEGGAGEVSEAGTPEPSRQPPPSERRSPKARPAPAAPEAPEASSPPQSIPRQQPSIALFPNVALAQTLPTGTAMGFSVNYEFVVGGPNPSSQYAWVVVPAKGRPAKMPVQLGRRGKLEGFFLELRPEHGPFKTHIEDDRGNRLSPSVEVKQQ